MRVHLLSEALNNQEKAQVDTWERPHHSFSDHAFGGEHESRTSIPLARPKSAHEHEIAAHLENHGFKLVDYHNGIVEGKFGRQQKLGKVLGRTGAQHLLDKYAADPSRAAKDTISDKYHVVISRHPHDVAGMTSEGHSWCGSSCMNFKTGMNRKYLPDEVKEGTHVAYLTHKDDHHIQEPVARIALKPYNSLTGRQHTILRPETRTYGNAPDSFSHTVKQWAHQHFPADEESVYEKSRKSYDDSGNRHEFGKSALESNLLSTGKGYDHERIRNDVANHPELPSSAIHKYFQAAMDGKFSHDLSGHSQAVRTLADHKNLHPDTAKMILDHTHGPKTSLAALVAEAGSRLTSIYGNRSVSADVNDVVLHHPLTQNRNKEYYEHFGNRQNLSHKAIDTLMDKGVSGIKLADHPGLSHQHVDKIIKDAEDPNLDHAEEAFSDKVWEKLAGNEALGSHHIHKVLDHTEASSRDTHRGNVYEQLLRNNKLERSHLDRIADKGGAAGRDALSWIAPVNGLEPKAHQVENMASQSDVHQGIRFAQKYKLGPASLDHLVDNIDNADAYTKHGSRFSLLRSNVKQNLTDEHMNTLITHTTGLYKSQGFDSDVGVEHVKAIANHPSTTDAHISFLQNTGFDPHTVTAGAAHRFKDQHYEKALQTSDGRVALAGRKDVPQKHLQTLIDHFNHEPTVSSRLMSNPSVGVEHIPKLVMNASSRYGAISGARNRGMDPNTPEHIRHQIGRALINSPHLDESDDGRYAAKAASELIPAKHATSDDLHRIISLGSEGDMKHHKQMFDRYIQFANYKPEHTKAMIDASKYRSSYDTEPTGYHENVLRDAKFRFPEHDFHDIKKHVQAVDAPHWNSALKEVEDNP